MLIIWLFCFLLFNSHNEAADMLAQPLWYRFLMYYVSASSQRVRYYIAWVLADVVNNASGLGFNGYDEYGRSKWDLVTNVRIFEIEVGKIKLYSLAVDIYIFF